MANCADIERTKKGKQVWNAWAEAEIAAGRQLDVRLDVLPGMTSLRGRVRCGYAPGWGELQTPSM
jgi:hypothetical protein